MTPSTPDDEQLRNELDMANEEACREAGLADDEPEEVEAFDPEDSDDCYQRHVDDCLLEGRPYHTPMED